MGSHGKGLWVAKADCGGGCYYAQHYDFVGTNKENSWINLHNYFKPHVCMSSYFCLCVCHTSAFYDYDSSRGIVNEVLKLGRPREDQSIQANLRNPMEFPNIFLWNGSFSTKSEITTIFWCKPTSKKSSTFKIHVGWNVSNLWT